MQSAAPFEKRGCRGIWFGTPQ